MTPLTSLAGSNKPSRFLTRSTFSKIFIAFETYIEPYTFTRDGSTVVGQAYFLSLNEDISVSEEDKILWVPHNKLKNGHYKMFAFILHRLVHK